VKSCQNKNSFLQRLAGFSSLAFHRAYAVATLEKDVLPGNVTLYILKALENRMKRFFDAFPPFQNMKLKSSYYKKFFGIDFLQQLFFS